MGMTAGIGSRLKARRQELGLSQRDVAKQVGITSGGLAHYETGTRSPGYEMVHRIARVLDLNADELMPPPELPPDATIVDDRLEISLLRQFRRLSPGAQQAIRLAIAALLEGQEAERQPSNPRG